MKSSRPPAHRIGELQQRQQREEFRSAVRALLMQPLMGPAHEEFPAVRRHSEALRDWFARETGWPLQVGREGARLYKRPADLMDPTRGLPGYDRRRYVLLCLACAILERAESQITLKILGDRLMQLAAEPALATRQFSFKLASATERREVVTVCRTLLDLGVLQRVAGDEDAFIQNLNEADALYDIHRRTLAGLLAAVRGPSTLSAEQMPETLGERLETLIAEPRADSDEDRRAAIRHGLARRLLDDPVVYAETLEAEARAYFFNQRGALATRLCEASGLFAEQRAEGLALTDEAGTLTDAAMPAEGTDSHVTLLVAEFLAGRFRNGSSPVSSTGNASVSQDEVALFLRDATERFGRFWRKSARLPGAERELAQIALGRLKQLRLIAGTAERIETLPAIFRFALGAAEVRNQTGGPLPPATGTLFD